MGKSVEADDPAHSSGWKRKVMGIGLNAKYLPLPISLIPEEHLPGEVHHDHPPAPAAGQETGQASVASSQVQGKPLDGAIQT